MSGLSLRMPVSKPSRSDTPPKPTGPKPPGYYEKHGLVPPKPTGPKPPGYYEKHGLTPRSTIPGGSRKKRRVTRKKRSTRRRY